jgi:hypothetical protein
MLKPMLSILAASCAIGATGHANAAYDAADARMRQQMVQSTTESAVLTSGARATAMQDAQSVAASRRIAAPTVADLGAEVKVSTIYAQAGPSAAAQGANTTASSRQMAPQTFNLGAPAAERWMEEAATP